MEMQKARINVIVWVLIIGLLVTLIKFIAYFITSSTAIYTDALENIINVVAAALAFYSIYLSALPKDENHPYGHGKVEFFAVGFEGALIVIAAISILYKSITNIFNPNEIHSIDKGIWLSIAAGCINFILGIFVLKKSKQLKSITLEADAKHLLSDAYTSIGLILGLILIYFTKWVIIDSIISIVLAFVILYNGYQLLRKSISGLMDETDTSIVSEIVRILNLNRKEEWIDIHNLRVQQYGNDLHIDCHLTLPYYYDLNKMHDEVQALHDMIDNSTENNVEFFIHVDPCLPECCSYCRLKDCNVRSSVKTIDIDWNTVNILKNAKHFNQHV